MFYSDCVFTSSSLFNYFKLCLRKCVNWFPEVWSFLVNPLSESTGSHENKKWRIFPFILMASLNETYWVLLHKTLQTSDFSRGNQLAIIVLFHISAFSVQDFINKAIIMMSKGAYYGSLSLNCKHNNLIT